MMTNRMGCDMEVPFSLGLEAEGLRWFAVSGAPRSGTTMIARLLNTHPRVGCLNEISLLDIFDTLRPLFAAQAERNAVTARVRANQDVGAPSPVAPVPRGLVTTPGDAGQMSPDPQRLADRYAAERDTALGGHGFGQGAGALDARLHGGRAARSLVEIVLDKADVTRCGTKYPNLDLVEASRALEADLLDLRLLHIVRRPSDVINSSLARRNKALRGADQWHIHSVEEACMEWMADWNRGSTARAVLGNRLLTIRYEDLVTDGPVVCDHIARHLEIEDAFDPSVCRAPPPDLKGYATKPDEAAIIDAFLGNVEATWDLPLPTLLERHPRVARPLPGTGSIAFELGGNGQFYAFSGFSIPENWGRWTDGTEARVDFRLDGRAGDLLLTLHFDVWRAQPSAPFEFIVAADNWRELVSVEQAVPGQILRRSLLVPRQALADPGRVPLIFHVLTPKAAATEPVTERRKLGLGLRRLEARIW